MMSSSLPVDLVELGKIVGAYGVKGWVKVETWAPAAQSLLGKERLWFCTNDASHLQFRVENCRVQGAGPNACLVAQLEGLTVREVAAGLRGKLLAIPRDKFPKSAVSAPAVLEEFYNADLLGLSVVNRMGVALGQVVGVDSHGAGDFLVIADSSAPIQHLIPFNSVYVDRVDVIARTVQVDWLPEWS